MSDRRRLRWPDAHPVPARDHADATLLVNAAGVFLPKASLEREERDYDLYLDINKALFFITQAVARSMVALRKGGRLSTSA
ncbi:hypothetical protein [Myxococcus sp. Y35]|uniref:hypothetical protein n=1 Tax=Pseudomyxococcus flavus TaxID=3115648 RepID=UPI003CF4DDC0